MIEMVFIALKRSYLLLQIRMVQALLMKSQMEMRNMVMETEGKAVLVDKVAGRALG